MQIFVETEKIIVLDVDSSNSIKQIKDAIYWKEGIHPDEQDLVYCEKTLEDGRLLTDYDIPTQAKLHLLLKNRPGEI